MLLHLDRLQLLVLLLDKRLLFAQPRPQLVHLGLLHDDLLVFGAY